MSQRGSTDDVAPARTGVIVLVPREVERPDELGLVSQRPHQQPVGVDRPGRWGAATGCMAAVAAMMAFCISPFPPVAPPSGRPRPPPAATAARLAAPAVARPPGGSRVRASAPPRRRADAGGRPPLPRRAPRMATCVRCGGDFEEGDNSPSAVRPRSRVFLSTGAGAGGRLFRFRCFFC